MAAGDLKPIPDIPEELRTAAQVGRLVPFVGAGVSQLAGCPNWDEFANKALETFVKRGLINYGQFAQYKRHPPRTKLSLARGLENLHKVKIPFKEILHPHPGLMHAQGQQIYANIGRLGNTPVTTNYDEWLDREIVLPRVAPGAVTGGTQSAALPIDSFKKRDVIYDVRQFSPALLGKPRTVVHLHGSVIDPESMVMTFQQYVELYANDRHIRTAGDENRMLTFLDSLFDRTVLFMGYGGTEMETLEYLVLKARQQVREGAKPRHYILQGFYSHEIEVMEQMRSYFASEMGLHLLPFLLDHKEWTQLGAVLEHYANEMPAADQPMAERYRNLEGLLDDED